MQKCAFTLCARVLCTEVAPSRQRSENGGTSAHLTEVYLLRKLAEEMMESTRQSPEQVNSQRKWVFCSAQRTGKVGKGEDRRP